MLTDDGSLIDRRILLEAQTLIARGFEVIIVARQDGKAPDGAIRDGAKVVWIPLDLQFTGGLLDEVDLSRFEPVPALPDSSQIADSLPPAPAIAVPPPQMFSEERRRHVAKKLKDGRAAWSDPSIAGVRRGRLAAGIAKAWIELKVTDRGQTTAEPGACEAAAPALPKPENIALNAWELPVYHRCVYYDPDIIHVHDLPQLLPAVLAKRALGVPLIYDSHEIYAEIGTLTAEQKELLRLKEKICLPHTDARITVNPLCSAFLETRYADYGARPFDVILNATVAPPGFTRGSSDDRIRLKLGLSPETRVLIFQGWMPNEGRSLKELVESMALVRKDVHLVMMGYGDFDFFRGVARSVGVEDRLHLIDAVPWDELVFWSAAADAGIIPYQGVDVNHTVASPNKLFEFIAAGLPILANDLLYLRFVIEGEGFGLVRDLTTTTFMAAGINEMFADDVLKRARRRLLQRGAAYEWPVEAAKLEAIYDRVIVNRRRP